MSIKIDQKIVRAQVKKPDTEEVMESTDTTEDVFTPVERPKYLPGITTKIKNAADDYNLYMTVNYHNNQPFEIFFDSSHTDSDQWVKALSRIASATLRSPDPNLGLNLIADQLMKVHSNKGYFAGGKGGWVPGIVFHIGRELKQLTEIGLLEGFGITTEAKTNSDEIKETVDELVEAAVDVLKSSTEGPGQECPECHDFTYMLMDGCMTCTACGYSKCG